MCKKTVTRNSSGDEIANVNFLYDDIVHAQQNTIDACINSATDRRGGYVLECMFSKFSEITQCNGHYAVLGHSRLPILVPIESSYTTSYKGLILTYLLSCTVSKLWLIIGQIFASEKGVPHSNALAGVIPCKYRHKWYIAKNYILWPTFQLQKVLVYLQPLLRNPSRNLWIRWNYTAFGLLRRSRSSKVTKFGTNRKLRCDFLMVNISLAPIFHRIRDIAFDRSNIAIFGYPSCV